MKRQFDEERWQRYGLNPKLLWAWYNLPIPRKPIVRHLPDGSAWVIEAFYGLELLRFEGDRIAKVIWSVLKAHENE
jgi:hypothetical protein